jgi:3-hydroxyisobutyrate dehydrogenase
MARVAWIGLGVMGFPMAGHLLKQGGHEITVYNRSPAKAAAWVAEYGGGHTAETPATAALSADFVFCCVGNDDDLRAVTRGEHGAFKGMRAGATFIDHTTASAEVARELNATGRARGIAFLDAPVSGGQAGAQAGALTVMVGGDEEPFERAKPLIASYARAVNRIGPSGAGQLTKMVNQIAIAGLLQGLSEAIAFAEAAGLDLDLVMQTISKGAAQSWQMDNRWKTMHAGKFDFGFAVDWMRKDLAICRDEAQRNGAELPVTTLVDEYYAEIQAMGGGRWDTSSLIALLKASNSKT